MFNKILVAIDGSRNAFRALEYAVDLAKKYDASITLIHVVERPVYPYVYAEGVAVHGDIYATLREEGEKLLAEKKEELVKKGLKAETRLVTGNPAEEVLKTSTNHDLIVIGSRGLGTVKTFLLGSVSTKVSQHAKKPVLIIRPA
ncbi:MAG: universal stress protein [Thaumarchaeota archaeon]|nr:universal stress protein [Nitrososphaerota archaeon]